MRTTLLSSLLVAALSACTSPVDRYDYPVGVLPAVEASATTARVGEPVTVTQTQTFEFSRESRRPVHTFERLEVGACVVNREPLISFGMCNYPDDTDTRPVAFLDGTTYKKVFTDVTVERGNTLTLTHIYTLTATEPVSFEVRAVLRNYIPGRLPDAPPAIEIGEGVQLTFE